MKTRAAVKAWQIEVRIERQMRHNQPARKRVQHGPTLRILDGGEAMAKAALQGIKPGLISAPAEE